MIWYTKINTKRKKNPVAMKHMLLACFALLTFSCKSESQVVDGVTWHFVPWKNGVAVRRDPTHDFKSSDYKMLSRWEYGCADLKIPAVLGGRAVVRIENDAFADATMSIRSVIIPSTVEEIGDRAFIQGYGLTSVVIPNGVRRIGREAFRNCYRIEKIELPSTVVEIGKGAFDGCLRLRTVVASKDVRTRFASAFAGCPEVKMRSSRTPWIMVILVLSVLLIFRKRFLCLSSRKGMSS